MSESKSVITFIFKTLQRRHIAHYTGYDILFPVGKFSLMKTNSETTRSQLRVQ